jgi:hypothetical protein
MDIEIFVKADAAGNGGMLSGFAADAEMVCFCSGFFRQFAGKGKGWAFNKLPEGVKFWQKG